jgi:hypothetical protein
MWASSGPLWLLSVSSQAHENSLERFFLAGVTARRGFRHFCICFIFVLCNCIRSVALS